MASGADAVPAAGVAAPAPGREVVIERVAASDWKLALIRLIEALVWPVAFIVVALIFRVPLTALIAALAAKLT